MGSDNFDTRNKWQALRGEIAIFYLVGIGVVDTDSGNIKKYFISTGFWLIDINELHDLWAAEFRYLNSFHGATLEGIG